MPHGGVALLRVRAYVASGDPDFARGKDDYCTMRKLGVCIPYVLLQCVGTRATCVIRWRAKIRLVKGDGTMFAPEQ